MSERFLEDVFKASMAVDLDTLEIKLKMLPEDDKHVARVYLLLSELSARMEAFGTSEQQNHVNTMAAELRDVIRERHLLDLIRKGLRRPILSLSFDTECSKEELRLVKKSLGRLQNAVESAICHKDPRWLEFCLECGLNQTNIMNKVDAQELLTRCPARHAVYDDFSDEERLRRFQLQMTAISTEQWWEVSRVKLVIQTTPKFAEWIKSDDAFAKEFRRELVKRSNGFQYVPNDALSQLGIDGMAEVVEMVWNELTEEEQAKIEDSIWQHLWDEQEQSSRDTLRLRTQSARLETTLTRLSTGERTSYNMDLHEHLLPFLAELQNADAHHVVTYSGKLVAEASVGRVSEAAVRAVQTKEDAAACYRLVTSLLTKVDIETASDAARDGYDRLLSAVTKNRFRFEMSNTELSKMRLFVESHGWKFPDSTEELVRSLVAKDQIGPALRVAQKSQKQANVEWLFDNVSAEQQSALEEAIMASLRKPSPVELFAEDLQDTKPQISESLEFTYDQARKYCVQRLGTAYFEKNPNQLKNLKNVSWIRQTVPNLESLYLQELDQQAAEQYLSNAVQNDDIDRLKLIERQQQLTVLEDNDYFVLRRAVAVNACQIVDYALKKLQLSKAVIDSLGFYAVQASEEMVDKIHEYRGACASGLVFRSKRHLPRATVEHLMRTEWVGERLETLAEVASFNNEAEETATLSRMQRWLAKAADDWSVAELQGAFESKAVRAACQADLPATKPQILAMISRKEPTTGMLL